MRLARRDFLKMLGGGLIVVFHADELLAQHGGWGRQYPTDLNAYLRIAGDGRVTCFTGKIEQGQGAINVLPSMLAEELDVLAESIDMVMGDTVLCPWDMGTFGSLTVRRFGPVLRQAGAEARAALLELASKKLGMPMEKLRTRDGFVFSQDQPEKRVSYGALVDGKKIVRRVAGKPALKTPAEMKVMRRPVHRRDAEEKVTGKAKYAGDIRLPGMLYARILRPPAHGAEQTDLDVSAAEAISGVRVVRGPDLVAVLHELPDVAARALDAIKASYKLPAAEVNDRNIFDYLMKHAPEGKVVAEGGSLEEGTRLASAVCDETYLNSYVAHAAVETHTALADVKAESATVWPSSQAPFRVRDEVAAAVGLAPEMVHVISPFVGGGFGGKTRNTQAVHAARLSKLTGKPVQVMWTREDEFFYDTFRPAAIMKIKSGLDARGRIVFWDYAVYYAGERSSQQFYDIPNHRTAVHGEWMGDEHLAHPFDVGAWRAPASNSNTFARESHIDVMAARAGIDPVEFRRQNLTDKRMLRVLSAAADKFEWKPAKAPSGRGFGVSCADYAGTYVVAMAEVEVGRKSGEISVRRMVCAQDPGVTVNPEGAAEQIEGCLTMGLGYALSEEVHFEGPRILDLNFDSYSLPRFSWVPKIETVILDSPDVEISGGGEPAIINVGAVLANAVFDALGARVLQLPMTPRRVLAALKTG
jgi:nicotinate dehydrogenase subunit B